MNPEHTIQYKLVKDPNSNRVNDLLIKKTITSTPYDYLSTFRDANKEHSLARICLKIIKKVQR